MTYLEWFFIFENHLQQTKTGKKQLNFNTYGYFKRAIGTKWRLTKGSYSILIDKFIQ